MEYRIEYDTTVFIDESIREVYKTLFEAIALVFLVVLVFLQDWRTTLIPMVAVPVCLVGTFAIMTAFGFSLNNLSLFGLVLAIGILVDDAIVVVENVERWMADGLAPREATIRAMQEITSPILATTFVLCAVFVPTAFIPGISGQFYRQFALTIAAATVISTVNALTMSPALAALLMRPHKAGERRQALPSLGVAILGGLAAYAWLSPFVFRALGVPTGRGASADAAQGWDAAAPAVATAASVAAGVLGGWLLSRPVNWALSRLFEGFNGVFDRITKAYGAIVRGSLRLSAVALVLYGGLIGLTVLGFRAVPTGFIPSQDKGYLVVNVQLPDAASLERTEDVIRRLSEIAERTEGVGHILAVPGYSILTGSNISNVGGMFLILEPFEERGGRPEVSADAVAAKLRKSFFEIQDAVVSVFGAPPVDGLGTTGGFKMQVQDRGALGPAALESAVQNVVATGDAQPGLTGLFSSFTANQPQILLNVDRVKAKRQGVSLSEVFETLQTYLGSAYVNDLTLFNRNWQVNVQAGARHRLKPEDVGVLKVRNSAGEMVPLDAIVDVEEVAGPAIVSHYNLYPSAEINGSPAAGASSGQAAATMDQIAARELPPSMRGEWTDLTFQQIEAAKDPMALLVFPLAVVLVFLVLAFQYESWSLPLAIVLIVPMGLLSAISGLWLASLDNNIFTQIGLVVLIGLAAKNAILIVEFAKQREDQGLDRAEATVSAAAIRLRPILMTSFAFIFGVLPLVLATGAGAEMRVAIGAAVFAGMLGVTVFGLFLTPVFYFVVRYLTSKLRA
jgi:multidrug efflux pump